ncbi:MAG: hypothetical protein CL927_02900 [Deltaproteobacteria bacterium]|nr:hypothetical protein [Deltaproteobacteria bacterium]
MAVYQKSEWAVVASCVAAVDLAALVQMTVVHTVDRLTAMMFVIPSLVGLFAGMGIIRLSRSTRHEKDLRGQLEQRTAEVQQLNDSLQERVERRTLELRAREAELVQSQKMEALARLAGGIAHDFNNLLTAILQGAELITELAEEPESVREISDDVRGAAERATELTSKLLTLSRRKRIPEPPRPVDLAQTVRDLSRLIDRLMGDRSAVSIELAPELPSIVADPAHLEQVLVNLCMNARDAMPEGGLLSIQVMHVPSADLASPLRGDDGHGAVSLRIQDTGVGIPDHLIDRVFEPLFTTKEPGAGTGLGLSIVRNLVEGAGGVVELSRPEAGGTVFDLFWPAQAPDVEAIAIVSPEQTDPPDAPSASPEILSVLVIDDDRSVRQMVSRALRARGHEVEMANGGDEAERIVRTGSMHFDVVLSDIHMPKRTGIELVPIWAEVIPTSRVVLMTGFTDHPLDEDRLRELQVVAVLRKPFDVAQLEAVLHA